MKITFLGHQGWHFQGSNGETILLDPLYRDMGNGLTRINVWPNRELKLGQLGKVDAVIISHEHADHFNIDTLLKIKQINDPDHVFVPNLSTRALKNALREMEFDVQELAAFEIFDLGSLSITPLPSVKSRFEPDVYSLLFEDKVSKSSFYTPIDTVPSNMAIEYLKEHCPKRTLDNYTNNFVQRIHVLHNLDAVEYEKGVNNVYEYLKRFIKNFDPDRIILSGQGWSYTGQLQDHNNIMFNVPHESLVKRLQQETKSIDVFAAEINTSYELSEETIKVSHADFVHFLPEDSREVDLTKLNGYELRPYCEKQDSAIANQQVNNYVENNLGSLLALGASKLNKALYYKLMETDDEHKGLFLELRNAKEKFQFEFSYSDSCFYRLNMKIDYDTAKKEYAFGMIGYVNDFLEILNAAEEGHLVSENSMYTWNHRYDLLDEPVDVDFMNCMRPQYRPVDFEKFYLEQIKKKRSK